MRRPSRPTGSEDRRTRCCQAKTVRTLPSREARQPAVLVPAAAGGRGPGWRCPGTSLAEVGQWATVPMEGNGITAGGRTGHPGRSLHQQRCPLHRPGPRPAALSEKPSGVSLLPRPRYGGVGPRKKLCSRCPSKPCGLEPCGALCRASSQLPVRSCPGLAGFPGPGLWGRSL